MQALRRLYLYVMSGITLAVVAYGLGILLRVLLDPLFPSRGADFEGFLPDTREQLSQAIAMLGVGFPAWAVHWWLVQRGVRSDRPERDEERGSDVRAIYLTGILLVSLVVWVNSGIALVHWLGTRLFDATPEYDNLDPLGAATLGAVALLIWLYHGLVRRRDLAAGPVSGPAAFVPRLYLYGVALGALFAAVQAFDSAVTSIFFAPAVDGVGGEDVYARYYLIERSVAAAGWGLVWLGHWWYASRVNRDPGWRGVEERQSRTRVAAFVTAIVAAAIGTLVSVAHAASSAAAPLLPDLGYVDNSGIAPIAVPLIQAVPWAILWFGHARALRREPAAADPARALHQARLVSHGVAAAALAIGGTGAGWLLGYGIDVVLGGQRSVEPGAAHQLANWLPLTVLGLGAWAWYWRDVIARRRLDPAGEAGSMIRRAFLFLTLGVALVAGIAAAAVILYRFVGIVLGAGVGGNLATELSTPLGALIAAAIALAYHGLALRGDQRLATSVRAEADAATPILGTSSADAPGPAGDVSSAPPQRRNLALVGPAGADLDAALASARVALPPGVELVSEEPEPAR